MRIKNVFSLSDSIVVLTEPIHRYSRGINIWLTLNLRRLEVRHQKIKKHKNRRRSLSGYVIAILRRLDIDYARIVNDFIRLNNTVKCRN